MGYSIYWDEQHQRDAGYGVPAKCDHPGCKKEIDRGLSHKCGDGSDYGCSLFFCSKHLNYVSAPDGEIVQLCERCMKSLLTNNEDIKPFSPKKDMEEWIKWKLTDSSWKGWRKENPAWVKEHKKILSRNKNANI